MQSLHCKQKNSVDDICTISCLQLSRASAPAAPRTNRVHFNDSCLEHVQYFFRNDQPLTIGLPGYSNDDVESWAQLRRQEPTKVLIVDPNFAASMSVQPEDCVRLQRVWLSKAQSSLLGSAAVANLAYQKHVVCRFTFDNWRTISEVTARYHSDVHKSQKTPAGYDYFVFAINLADMNTSYVESSTLNFCICYTVDGKEYWDNNGHSNFQIKVRRVPWKSDNIQLSTRRATWPSNDACPEFRAL